MEKMANWFFSKTSGKGRLVKNFFKNPANLILIAILLLASFMRLYKISEYMTFLGDEGRDAIIAREILQGNLTLLGPRASAGDFFLGPIYYYMMAPFLWLSNYDPVGPAIMVALLGIAAVFLVYFITNKFFGRTAGLAASALYAVSPLVIAFSRSSWNPNPVPFFTLLLIYFLYTSVKNQNLKLSFFVGIILGIMLQLHYIAVFLGVIVFAFVIIGNILVSRKSIIKQYLTQLFSIFIGFLLGLSPFLFFELRHSFPNIRTILNFVFVDNFQKERVEYLSHFEIVQDVLFRLYARLTLNFPPPEQVSITDNFDLQILKGVAYALIALSIIGLILTRKKLEITLMLTWFLIGIFLFGFYKRDIYDYYYGFLFPVPFILIGNFISLLTQFKGKIKIIGVIFGAVIFLGLFIRLISQHPFQYTPNNQKAQAEMIANFILDKTNGEPYNFALITLGNSDHVFRYFFEVENRPPVVIENAQIDPERKTVTDQLLVICENECSPVGHPLWEVAGFGPAKIDEQWKVSFFTVYRLVPSENN